MSAAHDAHADASAGHHDAHDHFDNEPSTELGADEPRTPNWVPILGLALFFSAGVAMLVTSGDDKPEGDKPAAAEAVQAAPPPTPQAPPQVRPAVLQPGQPGQPGQPAGNPLQQLSPEQREQIQKLIEQQRARQGGAAPGTPPGAAPAPGTPPGAPPGGNVVRPAPQPAPPGQPAHL